MPKQESVANEKLKTHRLRLYYFHEDRLFSNRVNLFLVAESMLFVSYVTALSIGNLNKCVSVIIGGLGITITILFGIVNINASGNLDKLKEKLADEDAVYKKLRNERKERLFPSANIFLGWLLIIAFFIAWFSLLFLKFCC